MGCDISTKEGQEAFYKNRLGETFCLNVTAKTAELVSNILADHESFKHTFIK